MLMYRTKLECCVIEYGSLSRVRGKAVDLSRYLLRLYADYISFPEESVPPNILNPDTFFSATIGSILLMSDIPRD